MYTKYVEALARQATAIFKDMTGTEVLGHKVKIDERIGDSIPMSHAIAYEHLEKNVKGQFVLGFTNRLMAVAVASALAEKMGLPQINELDEIALDILNEFMNTIVGRTIAEWDRIGMPVRFSPPAAIKFAKLKLDPSASTQSYVIILNLTFSHVIFRVTFSESSTEVSTERRVMVVEDSAVIRNIIARTLQQYQYEVMQAENGRKAVELYKSFKPQLVLMDLVMPQMGGFEAMESIRKSDPEASFIVLTSSSRRDEVLTARKLGVRAYLIKPFNPDSLLREVTKFFAPTS